MRGIATQTTLSFKKSSYSTGVETCVEVALPDDMRTTHPIAIRDSKLPAGPMLHFTPTAYVAFTRAVRGGSLLPCQ
ncbi:DUF397 domain-containing protein [Streptomyces stramineus]|uniref:DUF397 domain-containing protein n=1 Tax=Streptomyces stramineus TaxID=173861 RepID=A0ABN1AW81_9ACTN